MDNEEKILKLRETIGKKSIIYGNVHPIFSTKGTKKSDERSWLVDLRATLLDSQALEIIVDRFWDKYAKVWPFQVGGLEVGSIPLIAAIMLKGQQSGRPVNGFFVRKERKKTGLNKIIEGKVGNQPIILVDDLINSGKSIKKVLFSLEKIGKQDLVRSIFVIIDYERKTTHLFLKDKQISLGHIFKLKEFGLKLKQKNKKIKILSKFKIVWRVDSPDPNYFLVVPKSSPVTDDKNIYLGNDIGEFRAINQKTGQIVWNFKTGRHKLHKGIFSSPAICGDNIYFGGYNGNVYCLEKTSGKVVWYFTGADWVGSSPAVAVDLGLLYIGLEHSLSGKKGSIVALDLITGEKRWEFLVKEYLHGTPAYCKELGLVAIGTNDSELLLFKAKNGQLLWRFKAQGPMKAAPVFSVKHGVVIIGSHDGCVYIINIRSGRLVWSVKTDNLIYSTPVIFRDKGYVTSTDKNLYVLDLKNKKIFTKIPISGKILSSPCVIGNYLYFGANDGNMYELSLKNHRITGIVQFPERLTNKIAYNPINKLYFVSSFANQVFAIKKMNK